MSNYPLLVILFGLVVIVVLFERLHTYIVKRFINNQGWVLLESHWIGIQPSRGFLSKGDLSYQVRYLDRSGSGHNAYLRMSLFYGIEIEEDRIIKSAEEN